VVVLKKNGKLIICVDFRKMKKATKESNQRKSYPLQFSNEVLNIVVGYEAYSFLNGYLGYHQISIALDNRYKTTFIIDWGAFLWMVMPFGVKKRPPTFQKAVNRTFIEYLDQFMKIF
jgi:hypothetical protein